LRCSYLLLIVQDVQNEKFKFLISISTLNNKFILENWSFLIRAVVTFWLNYWHPAWEKLLWKRFFFILSWYFSSMLYNLNYNHLIDKIGLFCNFHNSITNNNSCSNKLYFSLELSKVQQQLCWYLQQQQQHRT